MVSAEEKSIADSAPDTTLGGLILSTAISTVKWLLIFGALGATLFCCLFPYNAMNIYRSFGNYSSALYFCDVCIDRSEKDGSEYSALLVNAVNMSATLLSRQTDKQPYSAIYDASSGYDKKVADMTEKLNGYCASYLSIPDDMRRSRSAAVDKYNIENSAAEYHPSVCNFEAYVYGEYVYTSQFIGQRGSAAAALGRLEAAVAASDIADAVIAICGLNAYYDFEFYRIGYGKSSPASVGTVTQIVSNDLEFLCGYIADVWKMVKNLPSAVDKLNGIRTLAQLADNIYAAAYIRNYPAAESSALMDECKAAKYVIGEETLWTYFYLYLSLYSSGQYV